MNCNGNDWVVGTERFPPSKTPNSTSPLAAKLDAMQLLMELNKKSNLKDISADQLRSVSEQLNKVLPTTSVGDQLQQQSHQRTTNGNMPQGVQAAAKQTLPQQQQQQQHQIGINGRKIAVPVKKSKSTATPPTPTSAVVTNGPSSIQQQQQRNTPPVCTAKNAKVLSNGGTSGNYNNNSNVNSGSNSKMSKMSPSSVDAVQLTATPAASKMANNVSIAPPPTSAPKTAAPSSNNNNNSKAAVTAVPLVNGNAGVPKLQQQQHHPQQNVPATAAVNASKEKDPQPQTSAATTIVGNTGLKTRLPNASTTSAKLSSAVSTQQRSVSVGRGTSAAASKNTATSTTSLPVPPNSPSRHPRNAAAPVNGSVNIAANMANR